MERERSDELLQSAEPLTHELRSRRSSAGFMIEGGRFEGGVVYYTGKSRPKFLFPDLGGRIRSKEYSIELVDNLSEAIQNSGVEYDENIITSHADSNDKSCVIDKQTSVELGVIRSERIPDLISTLTELPRGRISNHFRELLSNPPPEKCRKIIRNIVSEFLRNEEGLEETVVLDEERIVRCLRYEAARSEVASWECINSFRYEAP